MRLTIAQALGSWEGVPSEASVAEPYSSHRAGVRHPQCLYASMRPQSFSQDGCSFLILLFTGSFAVHVTKHAGVRVLALGVRAGTLLAQVGYALFASSSFADAAGKNSTLPRAAKSQGTAKFMPRMWSVNTDCT